MAKKGSFSKVYDKNGDYVDVEAARFDGTRTFQMQGDVSATQTWNGDSASALTLNTSIGAKKVTTDKINDKAVQTGQIDDGAVGLTQIATNAMNGTVQDNDSKLATHAAVKTYVDAQISGQGTYLGKHTVAEINAMVTDNLHNGDRVMTSDSGTINLGPGGVGFDVEAGEDLILYKSGSTVQWDSMDGNFKTKQSAVDDPTASGTGLTFIDSASQDENGEMTLSKKTVQDGTTSQKGVVQLEDSHSSTSTTKAATPNSVKEAYDLANTANTGAVKNVAYDSTNKKITKTINGQTTDVVSAATLKTDMSLNNVDNTSDANKPVSTAQQAALDLKLDKTGDGKDVTATFTEASTRANIGTGEKLSVIFGKIKKWFTDLGTAAFKNVPASGNASSTEVVLGNDTRLSAGASAVQDVTVDGASVVNSSTKVAAVPNASTSAKGAVQLAGSIGATVASENNKAATEKAVRDAINALDAEVTSSDGTNVQVKVTEADGKISAVNVTTDNTENKNNKVSSWQSTSDNTHYPSEKLVKDGLDAKADKVSGATSGNFAGLDSNGNLTDSGSKASDFATSAQGSKADSAIQGVKVNNTTLTPDANKVVTVPLATTSVDGAMSAADKTKLDGIEAGAEANVQSDWDETDSSSDAFIKNKPFYSKSIGGTAAIFKVCYFPPYGSSATSSGSGIDVQFRYGNGSVFGRLSYKNGFKLTLTRISELATSRYIRFFYVVGDVVDIYAQATNSYLEFKAAPSMNMPKTSVNFSNFGTVVSALPEGATEITPVWVANSASSSGTAPVKVDAYGALTPVPMDSTPTASSTNLMTSGDIKTALDGMVAKKTGFAYWGTQGSASFKIAEKTYSKTESHSEQFVFNVAYSKHSTNAATSELNVLLKVLKDGGSEVTVFTNTVLSKKGFGALEWTFKASVDDTNGKFTLYAERTAGNYTTVEATCIAANSERNNLIDDVVVFSMTTAELPETVFTETTVGALVRNSIISSVGSASVPVYVKADGSVDTCTDDFVHDADIAKMVQVETAGTAAGSSNQPVYVDTSGVAIPITFKISDNRREDSVRAGLPMWYVSQGQFDLPNDGNICYVELNLPASISAVELFLFVYRSGSPYFIKVRLYTFTYGEPGIVVLDKNGYTTSGISDIIIRWTGSSFKAYFKVAENKTQFRYLSTSELSNSNFSILTSAQYNALTSTIVCSATEAHAGAISTSARNRQRNYDIIDTGDVKSTYSSTGTDPVNGTAVAAALTTSLTEVEYVAAQSGGGGNLNKTKNGSTTSVMAFMTTAEARSVWTNAKAAVANAS